jgi:hypothetical protein
VDTGTTSPKRSCPTGTWHTSLRCSFAGMAFRVSSKNTQFSFSFSFSSFASGSRLADRSLRMTVDMSAAAHADLLFVKEMANGDSDLATYCEWGRFLVLEAVQVGKPCERRRVWK